MPTRSDLPPLPPVERFFLARDLNAYTQEQMMEFGAQSWHKAIEAAAGVPESHLEEAAIRALHLQAKSTASSSAE